MKKLDLVKAAKKGWPSTLSILNHTFRAINEALVRGETVTIYNFGEFRVVKDTRKEVYDFKGKQRIPFSGKLKTRFRQSPNVEKILNEHKGKAVAGTGPASGAEASVSPAV